MCPQCGAKVPQTSVFSWIIIIIFLGWVLGQIMDSGNHTPEPPKASLSKEQQAAENRFQKAGQIGALLKSSMREPDSIEWTSIMTNKDASIVCFEYKGKNGFGGVSFGKTVVINGKNSQSDYDWNMKCANKMLYDETLARRNIDSLYELYKNYH
jgi:hypothetical protein